MTGQDEREVAIEVLRAQGCRIHHQPDCSPVLNGCSFPEICGRTADALLAAGFHLTPTAEVKAEALRDVAEEALAEWCPHGDSHGDGSCECPLTDRLTVIVEAIATHLRESGGA